MKRIIYIILLLALSGNLLPVSAQSSSLPGESRTNPIPVETDPVFFSFQDTKNTLDYSNRYGGVAANAIFYKFVTTVQMDITICHCGSKVDKTIIHVQDQTGFGIVGKYGISNYCTSKPEQSYLVVPDLAPGTYYIVSYGYGSNGVISTSITGNVKYIQDPVNLIFTAPTANPDVSQNYIQKRIIREENYKSIPNLSNSIQTLQYFDGLGRPIEIVQVGASPKMKDLVSYTQYDEFGRESKSWLPANIAGTQGAFRPFSEVKNAVSVAYKNDSRPFSEPSYESSPLNRVEEVRGPGDNWVDHPAKTEYLSNTGDDVLSCSYYYLSGDNLVKSSENYAPNELFVKKLTNEAGNESYEFTDKLGQVVLQRQINEGEPHDTYYVYDDLNNLRYVLPPMAVDMEDLSVGVNKYGYVYRYDERNRCITKKLPGNDSIYYVYDRADRLILSQDGVQRVKGEWLFNKYDVYGRLILSGVKKLTQSASELQTTYKNSLIVETFKNVVPGYVYYYSNTSGLSVTTSEVDLVNYYDNHSWLTAYQNNFPQATSAVLNHTGLGFPQYGSSAFSSAQGLLTGTMTKLLNTSPAVYLKTSFYYDFKGNLVGKHSENYMKGYDKEYYSYNFAGELSNKYLLHYNSSSESLLEEEYRYRYDHMGRMTGKYYGLNGGPLSLMAAYSYNELGQLVSKNIGGVETVNHQYNIRNWLTELKNNKFSETLSYDNQFGGNIASTSWVHYGINHHYDYEYDNLGRLKGSVYSGEGSRDYSESLSYDKQGNPLSLVRKGRIVSGGKYSFGVIDSLSMSTSNSYDGNRLVNVIETAPNQLSNDLMEFKKNTGTSPGYSYDANGNLTRDLHKNSGSYGTIQYNYLNLPTSIQTNGGTTSYTYDALGVKHQVYHRSSSIPMGYLQTTYCGNTIYKNGVLSTVLTEEGYLDMADSEFLGQNYYLKDHLGSNRSFFTQFGGSSFDAINYYPFGMSFAELGMPAYAYQEISPYKYNGKELDKINGLNMYDYGARMYDPAIGRFSTMDPMAEKYYSISPYAYCLNNPIKYVDPNGEDVYLVTWASHDGNVGHTGIAVDNYKTEVMKDKKGNVVLDKKGNAVTQQVKDGTVTYYDLGPGESVGKGNYADDVSGSFNSKVMPVGDLTSTNVRGGTKPAPDGIVQLSTSASTDELVNMSLSAHKDANSKYNGMTNNCTDYAKSGIEYAAPVGSPLENTREQIGSRSVVTPNYLYNATIQLPNATVVRSPGNKTNTSFVNAVGNNGVRRIVVKNKLQ